MPNAKKSKGIDGEHALYHYLQKDLLTKDIWLFQMLAARLVVSLGIWLHPDVYRHFPVLRPYAVREPHSRGNKALGIPDQWGVPNEHGYFSDDNSLVKGVPKPLSIESATNANYSGRRIAKGFVASHVWREIPGGGLASRNPLTYSFVPNLVWLPAQVSKLTDREGSFTQSYLQAISRSLYKPVPLSSKLEALVAPIWQLLPEPTTIPLDGLPREETLNYFRSDPSFFKRRMTSLATVLEALHAAKAGHELPAEVLSHRFRSGLPHLEENVRDKFLSQLSAYRDAVLEANAD